MGFSHNHKKGVVLILEEAGYVPNNESFSKGKFLANCSAQFNERTVFYKENASGSVSHIRLCLRIEDKILTTERISLIEDCLSKINNLIHLNNLIKDEPRYPNYVFDPIDILDNHLLKSATYELQFGKNPKKIMTVNIKMKEYFFKVTLS